MLLFSIVLYFVLIPGFVAHDVELTGLSPRFFPKMSAITLGILSACFIILKLAEYRKGRTEEKHLPSPPNEPGPQRSLQDRLRPFFSAGILIAYFYLFENFGFLIGTPICLICMMLLFGMRKPATILITCFVVTVTLFTLFEYGLRVPLG